ncbi:MAG: hypothetical protein IJY50_03860 [Clostridia bacterium]|nr:hypothetical protein [Clostridia bacterium]
MNRTETYEKEYFSENYKEQFETLRNRYRTRTQEALRGRKVDHNPIANATTIVYLHDDENGGTHITTGDFVEYFNNRFGGYDRIGAMQRSISNAVRKVETRREAEERRGAELAARQKQERRGFQPLRSARPKLAFLNAIFAVMLVISIGILTGTSALLENTQNEVLALEEEVAMLETAQGVASADQYNTTSESAPAIEYPDMAGGDSVEIYPAQNGGGVEMAALLNALASLGK